VTSSAVEFSHRVLKHKLVRAPHWQDASGDGAATAVGTAVPEYQLNVGRGGEDAYHTDVLHHLAVMFIFTRAHPCALSSRRLHSFRRLKEGA